MSLSEYCDYIKMSLLSNQEMRRVAQEGGRKTMALDNREGRGTSVRLVEGKGKAAKSGENSKKCNLVKRPEKNSFPGNEGKRSVCK